MHPCRWLYLVEGHFLPSLSSLPLFLTPPFLLSSFPPPPCPLSSPLLSLLLSPPSSLPGAFHAIILQGDSQALYPREETAHEMQKGLAEELANRSPQPTGAINLSSATSMLLPIPQLQKPVATTSQLPRGRQPRSVTKGQASDNSVPGPEPLGREGVGDRMLWVLLMRRGPALTSEAPRTGHLAQQ